MQNQITAHLIGNGMSAEQIENYTSQIEECLVAGAEYRDTATAGLLVEAIAILYADLLLDGFHETTDPYSIYTLAIEEEVA